MLYRQSLILYADKHGVTKAAIRYNTNRQYIYRWRKRYDSTLQSLADRSHRPHHHPNQHRPEEIKLIDNMRRRNPNTGSGSNSGREAIPDPSRAFTDFCGSEIRWP